MTTLEAKRPDAARRQHNGRTAELDIPPLFLQRWSPRGFTESRMSDQQLRTVIEAGRWAPSSYNTQPWRFIFARRDTAKWPVFLDLLDDFNRSWAQRAAALVVLVSDTCFTRSDGEVVQARNHSFDAGAAWALLGLQAVQAGWHAHCMAGFDVERARRALGIPDTFRVEVAIAIGEAGDEHLLDEVTRSREVPSDRKPLADMVFHGNFDRMNG